MSEKQNTDRELWRASAEPGREAYADSVHVTEYGQIKLCRGGFCIYATIEQWHYWADPERRIADAVAEATANPGRTVEVK